MDRDLRTMMIIVALKRHGIEEDIGEWWFIKSFLLVGDDGEEDGGKEEEDGDDGGGGGEGRMDVGGWSMMTHPELSAEITFPIL